MAPTADEELKLRLYSGELSQLGPAERFLKALVNIPFAFKRLEALLFMCILQEEVATTKESFETLEVGNWILYFFSALGLILAYKCWLPFLTMRWKYPCSWSDDELDSCTFSTFGEADCRGAS